MSVEERAWEKDLPGVEARDADDKPASAVVPQDANLEATRAWPVSTAVRSCGFAPPGNAFEVAIKATDGGQDGHNSPGPL
jgi:hypothetical protein